MILLGMDTTGQSMSVAVTDGGRLLGELYVDNGKKHASMLMPAVDDVLRLTGMELRGLDGFAVAKGPGSFTGIRIGMATVSALAYAVQKPVYMVNTLEALLENVPDGTAKCAMMDARRGEVYTMAVQDDTVLVRECAVPVEELLHTLAPYGKVAFVGDGVPVHREVIRRAMPDSIFLPEQFLRQRASSVCACVRNGRAKRVAHNEIKPHYLRESQAERIKREQKEQKEVRDLE